MERKAFTIVRSTWHRGLTAIGSRLLKADTGKMCCLGSIALQAGATADQILEVTSPGRLVKSGVTLFAFAPLQTRPSLSFDGHGNTELAQKMMCINDDSDITDALREEKLTTLAATIGWDLTFVD